MPLLALVAVTAVWGLTFVQVKDAVAVYPLFAFLTWRFAIASLTLAPLGLRRLGSLGGRGTAAAALLGLLLAVGYALQTAGLERTTASGAGFVTGMYVVLTPLLALLFFRTRASRAAWFGVVLATLGLALLSGVHADSPVGDLARPRCRRCLRAADRADGALRAARDPLALTLVEMLAALAGLAAVAGARWRARPGAAWMDGVECAACHRHLRECARLPRPELGATADERDAHRARIRARACLCSALRISHSTATGSAPSAGEAAL